MGLFSGIASIFGAGAQKSASRNAEQAQLGYLNKALDYTKQQSDTAQTALSPYEQAGTGALSQINDLLGISTPGTTDWAAYVNGNPDALANWNAIKNTSDGAQFGGDMAKFGQYHYAADGSRRDLTPYNVGGSAGGADAQAAAIAQLQASPAYQSLYRNGQEAVLQNASATGGLRGGNVNTSLANFGADTLTQTINDQLQRLGGLTGAGLSATGTAAQVGQNAATQVGNIFGTQGQVASGGILTRGGLTAKQIGNIGGIADSVAGAVSGRGGLGSILKGLF